MYLLYKINNLTKNQKLFIVLAIVIALLQYFSGNFSLFFTFFNILVFLGMYYLLFIHPTVSKSSMKKKTLIVFGYIVIMISFVNLFLLINPNLMFRSSVNVVATKQFVKIDSTNIQNDIENKKKKINFIYVGSETCSICKEFGPKLKQAAKETNSTIYYIDTDKKTDSLTKFIDQSQIQTIPTLLVFKDGQLQQTLLIDENTRIDYLKEFLHNHKYNRID